jgi:amidophosphoribosyltransferase
MASRLGADSLRYLPIESVARSIGMPSDALCEACLTGRYPTPAGEKLYQLALGHDPRSGVSRTYETVTR